MDLPALYCYSNSNSVFSPAFYVDTFLEMGVTAVVWLNKDNYYARIFDERGIAHFNLEFEDCTVPPEDIVTVFFRIVESTVGMVVIHCKVSPPIEAAARPHTVGCLGRAAWI